MTDPKIEAIPMSVRAMEYCYSCTSPDRDKDGVSILIPTMQVNLCNHCAERLKGQLTSLLG
jgi:hypothetical protein